ncbi:hypothetical protein KDA23_02555 [Candidatus Saccharibacteria bacterium]|nr:hypothetical protein [Candidatus Saccharibacteria bacterium]
MLNIFLTGQRALRISGLKKDRIEAKLIVLMWSPHDRNRSDFIPFRGHIYGKWIGDDFEFGPYPFPSLFSGQIRPSGSDFVVVLKRKHTVLTFLYIVALMTVGFLVYNQFSWHPFNDFGMIVWAILTGGWAALHIVDLLTVNRVLNSFMTKLKSALAQNTTYDLEQYEIDRL